MSTVEELIAEIEHTHEAHNFDKVKELIETGLAAHPNNVELLCFKARSIFDDANSINFVELKIPPKNSH